MLTEKEIMDTNIIDFSRNGNLNFSLNSTKFICYQIKKIYSNINIRYEIIFLYTCFYQILNTVKQ